MVDSLQTRNKHRLVIASCANIALYMFVLSNGFEVESWAETFANLLEVF